MKIIKPENNDQEKFKIPLKIFNTTFSKTVYESSERVTQR